jgi:hypothetical protein
VRLSLVDDGAGVGIDHPEGPLSSAEHQVPVIGGEPHPVRDVLGIERAQQGAGARVVDACLAAGRGGHQAAVAAEGGVIHVLVEVAHHHQLLASR